MAKLWLASNIFKYLKIVSSTVNEKKQFSIYKKLQISIIFFLITLFLTLSIPVYVITSCHLMGIVGYIWIVIGIVISIWYRVTGGFIKHQKLEAKLFKLFVPRFDTPQPGKIAEAIFFSIGSGFMLAGAILQLYVYVSC